MGTQSTASSEFDRAFLVSMNQIEPLDEPRERFLARRAAAGDAHAAETLCTHSSRQIITRITSYRDTLGPRVAGGLEYMDLFQECSAAVLTATKSFKPDVGTRFRDYADRAITSAINKALAYKEDPIRLPEKVGRLERAIFRFESELADLGVTQMPSDADVAQRFGATIAQVQSARTAPRVGPSLDQTINDDGDTLAESIQHTHAHNDPIEELFAEIDEPKIPSPDELKSAIPLLKHERDRQIATKRLVEGKSVETTAGELGVSPQRVSEQQKRTFGKLRSIVSFTQGKSLQNTQANTNKSIQKGISL